jgi:hypothetical protein
VCDCSVGERPSPVRVVDFHAEPEESHLIMARSLGEMVGWWIEGLEGGAYRYDHESDLWHRDESLITPERLNTLLV